MSEFASTAGSEADHDELDWAIEDDVVPTTVPPSDDLVAEDTEDDLSERARS